MNTAKPLVLLNSLLKIVKLFRDHQLRLEPINPDPKMMNKTVAAIVTRITRNR